MLTFKHGAQCVLRQFFAVPSANAVTQTTSTSETSPCFFSFVQYLWNIAIHSVKGALLAIGHCGNEAVPPCVRDGETVGARRRRKGRDITVDAELANILEVEGHHVVTRTVE